MSSTKAKTATEEFLEGMALHIYYILKVGHNIIMPLLNLEVPGINVLNTLSTASLLSLIALKLCVLVYFYPHCRDINHYFLTYLERRKI